MTSAFSIFMEIYLKISPKYQNGGSHNGFVLATATESEMMHFLKLQIVCSNISNSKLCSWTQRYTKVLNLIKSESWTLKPFLNPHKSSCYFIAAVRILNLPIKDLSRVRLLGTSETLLTLTKLWK